MNLNHSNQNDLDNARPEHRYIYEVIRHVPRKQRAGISLELQELISDMTEEAGANPDMDKILSKLGDPVEFAKKYRDEKQYLIGPDYFEDYVWVLKIVLCCTAAAVLFSNLLKIMEADQFKVILSSSIESVTDVITSLLSAFGSVTLLFFIFEKLKLNIEIKKNASGSLHEWKPEDLPPIPGKKGQIKRSDTIVGLVFTVILCALIISIPQIFGISVSVDGVVQSFPVWNLTYWHILLPLILLSLGIGFVDQIIQLVIGRYCPAVVISNAISGTLQIILSFILLKVLPFWNESFFIELMSKFGSVFGESFEFIEKIDINQIASIVFALAVISCLVEFLIILYRTAKYGVK